MADLHVPLRAGTDIVFLGAIVNHIIANELLLRGVRRQLHERSDVGIGGLPGHRGPRRLVLGLGPGEQRRTTRPRGSTKGAAVGVTASQDETAAGEQYPGESRRREASDPSLRHPRCVFQILKRHFARYTPEMVEDVCGVPPDLFRKVADALCENSGRERTSAFCYAVGWTQHTVGVQYIRTAAIVQLLLGNIGRPGGGILALRGHASIQGSTDIPTLYNLLPGYLPMPKAGAIRISTRTCPTTRPPRVGGASSPSTWCRS